MSTPNEESRRRTITVTGNGEIKAKPDYTEIDFSLTAKSKKQEHALKENNEQLESLYKALRAADLPDDSLITRDFKVEKRYHTNYLDKKATQKKSLTAINAAIPSD